MYSVAQVEQGLAKYIDAELLPALPRDGLKGFGIGVGAALLVRRGGGVLTELCQNKALQTMGVVTADGMIDLDVLRDICRENIPQGGLPVPLPMGLQVRLKAEDVDKIYQCIVEG